MSGTDDRLREALARWLADEEAATRGALPYADTSWACVRGRWLPKADRFLPVVRAYGDLRAAEELRAAAERLWSGPEMRSHLRDRAAALTARGEAGR